MDEPCHRRRRATGQRRLPEWYNRDVVRQIALTLLIGLLTFNVSGVVRVATSEPCTGLESAEQDDRSCPPTCATCGCCAQSIEPVPAVAASAPPPAAAHIVTPLPAVPGADPRDILHVPKASRT